MQNKQMDMIKDTKLFKITKKNNKIRRFFVATEIK